MPHFTTSVELQEHAKFKPGQKLRIEMPNSGKSLKTIITSVKLTNEGYDVEYEVVEWIGDWTKKEP